MWDSWPHFYLPPPSAEGLSDYHIPHRYGALDPDDECPSDEEEIVDDQGFLVRRKLVVRSAENRRHRTTEKEESVKANVEEDEDNDDDIYPREVRITVVMAGSVQPAGMVVRDKLGSLKIKPTTSTSESSSPETETCSEPDQRETPVCSTTREVVLPETLASWTHNGNDDDDGDETSTTWFESELEDDWSDEEPDDKEAEEEEPSVHEKEVPPVHVQEPSDPSESAQEAETVPKEVVAVKSVSFKLEERVEASKEEDALNVQPDPSAWDSVVQLFKRDSPDVSASTATSGEKDSLDASTDKSAWGSLIRAFREEEDSIDEGSSDYSASDEGDSCEEDEESWSGSDESVSSGSTEEEECDDDDDDGSVGSRDAHYYIEA